MLPLAIAGSSLQTNGISCILHEGANVIREYSSWVKKKGKTEVPCERDWIRKPLPAHQISPGLYSAFLWCLTSGFDGFWWEDASGWPGRYLLPLWAAARSQGPVWAHRVGNGVCVACRFIWTGKNVSVLVEKRFGTVMYQLVRIHPVSSL